MNQVVNTDTNEVLGILSSIDKIPEVAVRYRYEPFVHKFNFFVFEDQEGNFGVASPRNHVIREVFER